MQFKKLLTFLLMVISCNVLNAQDWLGYVGNGLDNTVSVINVTTNAPTPIATIPGFNNPINIAFTPDRQFGYFSNQGDVTVSVVTGVAIVDTITLPANGYGVAVSTDGTKAYVVFTDFAAVAGISVIDIPANTISSTIPVTGITPQGIALTSDGQKAFVSFRNENEVHVIDLSTNVATPITGFNAPFSLAITPDGTKVYVTESSGIVQVIDVATNLVTPVVNYPVGISPFRIAITPNGTKAFVSNANNTVSVIDIATQTWITDVAGFTNPSGIAISPDSQLAYVVNQSLNNVLTINVATNAISPIFFTVGNIPASIAITPDQAPTAAFTFTSPSTFNASASSSPTGSIATYTWDFGDGSPVVTVTDPIILHAYASTGPFNVTLTVVNTAGTSTTQTFTGQTVSNNGGPSATITQAIVVSEGGGGSISPPIYLNARRDRNEFLTQTEYFNVLKWNAPSIGPTPVAYHIYRNSALTDLVAVVNATSTSLKYEDHNRRKHVAYTYYVVSVDQAGNKSTPAVVTVP